MHKTEFAAVLWLYRVRRGGAPRAAAAGRVWRLPARRYYGSAWHDRRLYAAVLGGSAAQAAAGPGSPGPPLEDTLLVTESELRM